MVHRPRIVSHKQDIDQTGEGTHAGTADAFKCAGNRAPEGDFAIAQQNAAGNFQKTRAEIGEAAPDAIQMQIQRGFVGGCFCGRFCSCCGRRRVRGRIGNGFLRSCDGGDRQEEQGEEREKFFRHGYRTFCNGRALHFFQ